MIAVVYDDSGKIRFTINTSAADLQANYPGKWMEVPFRPDWDATHKVVEGKLMELPPDPALQLQIAWTQVRIKRDALLEDVDLPPLKFALLTPVEVARLQVYRKALLDIPQVYSDPTKVVWPPVPTDILNK